jgi:hypothetical protein
LDISKIVAKVLRDVNSNRTIDVPKSDVAIDNIILVIKFKQKCLNNGFMFLYYWFLLSKHLSMVQVVVKRSITLPFKNWPDFA